MSKKTSPVIEETPELAENGEVVMTFGARSFADLMKIEQAKALQSNLEARTKQLTSMIESIMFYSDGDRIVQIRALFDEYIAIAQDAIANPPEGEPVTYDSYWEGDLQESGEPKGVILGLEEDASAGPRDPLRLSIAVIEPGVGNKRDRHYYGREMLAENAHLFKGAKMYATGHSPQGRGDVRNEVSVIEEMTGFTESGAPIARVVIFDADFAETTRNRARAGQLGTLQCSILAHGNVKEAELDGQKVNMVESITSVESVDWVSRAGAGGRAMDIAESELQKAAMTGTTEQEEITEGDPEVVEEVLTEEEPAPVSEPEPEVDPAPVTEAEPVDVSAALQEAGIAAPLAEQIAAVDWANADQIEGFAKVLAAQIAGIQQPGAAFGLGETAQPAPPNREQQLAEGDAKRDELFSRYGLR